MDGAYPRQPNTPWGNMEVHREINDPRLEVVGYFIDNDLRANVDKLDVGQIGLCNRLVNLFVVPNTIPKVPRSHFRVLADVIWRGGFYFKDVAHDQIFIVTLALNEEDIVALSLTALRDPFSPALGRVCSIKDPDMATLVFEPAEHVGNSGFSSRTTEALTLKIASVEKVGCGLWSVRTAVGSNVEGFSVDRKPFEVANDCGYEISEPKLISIPN